MWEEQLHILIETNDLVLFDDWLITYEAETGDCSLSACNLPLIHLLLVVNFSSIADFDLDQSGLTKGSISRSIGHILELSVSHVNRIIPYVVSGSNSKKNTKLSRNLFMTNYRFHSYSNNNICSYERTEAWPGYPVYISKSATTTRG